MSEIHYAETQARQSSLVVTCSAFHTCHCGMATHTPHDTGHDGCQRFLVTSPKPAPDDPVYGKMWEVDGHIVTDYTLRAQDGYYQHDCGCWSRWEGSVNSLPDET